MIATAALRSELSALANPLKYAVLLLAMLLAACGGAEAQSNPVITSFSPTSGPAGTVVTVRGSNLFGVRTAELQGSPGVSTRNVTSTSLQFTISSVTTSGRVRLLNSCCAGLSSGTFQVTGDPIVRPNITGFSPASGPVGTLITVNGTNLHQVSQVTLNRGNTVAPSNVTATSLTFVLPSGLSSGPIRVINPAYDDFSSSSFTITSGTAPVVPTISSFAPTSGPAGTVITVNGSGFTGATGASVNGGATVAVSDVTATSLRFTVPSGASSGVVRITNGNRTGVSSGSYTVTTPVVTPAINGFSPASGPVGTVITVTGSGLGNVDAASLNGGSALAVTDVTATSVRFAVPSGASSGIIRVRSGSTIVQSSGSFSVTAAAANPVVSSFSPTSGPVGTVITVAGSGFTGATGASINGGATVAVSNVTSTSLRFTVPSGASSGVVRITNGTNTGASSGSYSVTVAPATPVVSSFSPTSGPVGTVITVSGSGFTGATGASINGGATVAVSNVTATSLRFTVPSGASSGIVRITNGTNIGASTGSYSVSTTPLPPPPTGAIGETAAVRLLTQGTFGPTLATISSAAGETYDQWFSAQAAAPRSLIAPSVPDDNAAWAPVWWRNVVTGPDQLRQRMAFALSEIFVVSEQSDALAFRDRPLAIWYDLLTNNSLGNFRSLMEDVTLSPAMGRYLTHFRNDKPNPAIGRHADENYARELLQLFTIGLVELNIDGSTRLDASGNPIPTYTQEHVRGLANVFTGWASAPTLYTGETAWLHDDNYVLPMVPYESHHETSAKLLPGGIVVPAGGTARQDLKIALDAIFNHPNVGPFVGLRLIQRLVTSNPSPAYVERVARVFNDNGSGVRGDLLAVARAILTDPEAVNGGDNTYGKLREPLIRLTHVWRAFSASAGSGQYRQFQFLSPLESFGQSPLAAPSVFNFFAPDYQRVGNIAFAGLVSPEFQNTNENTLILTANLLQEAIYQYQDSAGRRYAGADPQRTSGFGSDDVFMRTAAWEGFASNPATLVDRLSLVFLQGQMPAAMRTTLLDYVNAIPASQPANRVIETLDLIVNSPQYAVQR